MRRLLPLAAVICLCIACHACAGRKKVSAVSTAMSAISLTETAVADTVAFGKVKTGEIVSRTIVLSNYSAQPIAILSTDTSCGCLRLEYETEPLGSGKTMQAVMTFDSAGYTFFGQKTFYVRTSFSEKPKKLIITAEME